MIPYYHIDIKDINPNAVIDILSLDNIHAIAKDRVLNWGTDPRVFWMVEVIDLGGRRELEHYFTQLNILDLVELSEHYKGKALRITLDGWFRMKLIGGEVVSSVKELPMIIAEEKFKYSQEDWQHFNPVFKETK